MNGKYKFNGQYKLQGGRLDELRTSWSIEHPDLWNNVRIWIDGGRLLGSALIPDMQPQLISNGGDDMEALMTAIRECSGTIKLIIDKTISRINDQSVTSSPVVESNHQDETNHIDAVGKHDLIPDAMEDLIDVPWTDLHDRKPAQTIVTRGLDHVEKGYEGERLTAAAIGSMQDDHWFVMHSIPTRSNSDIDHVLISSRGIFVLDSKNVTNGYHVNGSNTKYLSKGVWTDYDIQKDMISRKDLKTAPQGQGLRSGS
jgi:hypothetical protein